MFTHGEMEQRKDVRPDTQELACVCGCWVDEWMDEWNNLWSKNKIG